MRKGIFLFVIRQFSWISWLARGLKLHLLTLNGYHFPTPGISNLWAERQIWPITCKSSSMRTPLCPLFTPCLCSIRGTAAAVSSCHRGLQSYRQSLLSGSLQEKLANPVPTHQTSRKVSIFKRFEGFQHKQVYKKAIWIIHKNSFLWSGLRAK